MLQIYVKIQTLLFCLFMKSIYICGIRINLCILYDYKRLQKTLQLFDVLSLNNTFFPGQNRLWHGLLFSYS